MDADVSIAIDNLQAQLDALYTALGVTSGTNAVAVVGALVQVNQSLSADNARLWSSVGTLTRQVAASNDFLAGQGFSPPS